MGETDPGQLPNTATDIHSCLYTGWSKNRNKVERLVDLDNDNLIMKAKLCTQAKKSEQFAQYFPLASFWKAGPQYTISNCFRTQMQEEQNFPLSSSFPQHLIIQNISLGQYRLAALSQLFAHPLTKRKEGEGNRGNEKNP